MVLNISKDNEKIMATKRSSEIELAVTGATAAVPSRRKNTTPTRTRKTTSASVSPATPTVTVSDGAPVELDYDAVAVLAYSFWEARGYQSGSPEEDWLRAENELRSRQLATA